MPTIYDVSQQLVTDSPVSLFTLDASPVNGGIHRFCPASQADSPVLFDGISYTPADVRFSGMMVNGAGQLPQPKFEVANSDGFVQAVINTAGDLVGCTVTRIRTFKRFLDGQPDADPTAFYGPDIFRVERKSAANALSVEWELSASIDQEGKLLPGRLVIRNTCLWRYRVWTGAAFDYSQAQCPYNGATSYDINNQVTTSENDKPSRDIACCKSRFGEDQPLPFGGFPGVGRIRP